jgi:hypothetical protein
MSLTPRNEISILSSVTHRPGQNLPEAIAVLDPKRDDCNYPYDELCGCGIGFKLIQALGLNQDRRRRFNILSRSSCRRHRC